MVTLDKPEQITYEGSQIGCPIEDLTDRQREILKLIIEDNKLTKRNLAK